MEFRKTYSLDDILIVPRFSPLPTRKDCDISSSVYKLPIIMSPMDTLDNPEMLKLFIENQAGATIHRYFKTPQEQLEVVEKTGLKEAKALTWFAVGSVLKYKDWIDYLFDNGVRTFMVDMAHGDSQLCVETIEYIKQKPSWAISKGCIKNGKPIDLETETHIIAGNVVTKAGFDRLQKAGANGIRVGIGSGSICTTRINCGIGVPQATAIMDCAERKNPGTWLIADGGIKNTGDMVKAIALGADLCMCGKLLASTDLATGQCYNRNKQPVDIKILNSIKTSLDTFYIPNDDVYYKAYRGMSSKEAREGVMTYSSIEGVSGLVRFIGTTEQLLTDIRLRLQSAQSYLGVKNWNDFRKYAKIQIISESSFVESKPTIEEF